MNIHPSHHIFRGRFVYIHTFFCSKIMWSRQLLTCLYDIQHTDYDRRLYYDHVSPPVPIWAKFTLTIDKMCPWSIWAAMPVLCRPVCLHSAAAIIYRHILLGENSFDLIRTRAHEKIRLDFLRAEPLYVLYIAGKM